ncbi:class I SAM-dependent methyltransferase [Ferrimonas balearica]|uniref:class I SAM-dependent methyltransferase n=1 Tax=Ferrimonas balearica TaxID=44012 RepID=UPI001F429C46|nr:class I SAM-dependent methyltransferase [Ferrimonas balearica]MBY6096342.1 class I SAM-dependent methyltransferase [Ferrimonas balearica]
MSTTIYLDPGSEQPARLAELAQRWQLHHCEDASFRLTLEQDRLRLYDRHQPKLGAIEVDLVGGAVAHRRKFGGGRGQAIAKAVGLKGGASPSVVDGTAGLGRDAFVLASLGCDVTLVERHPVVAALLDDGLRRAYDDAEIGPWVSERMRLFHGNSLEALAELDLQADVVFLDPMYPHRAKSAQVKKEMRVFQDLVGADMDADGLLAPALQLAQKRVVVKRPDYAEPLADRAPTMVIDTKKNRFDVYVKAAMAELASER